MTARQKMEGLCAISDRWVATRLGIPSTALAKSPASIIQQENRIFAHSVMWEIPKPEEQCEILALSADSPVLVIASPMLALSRVTLSCLLDALTPCSGVPI